MQHPRRREYDNRRHDHSEPGAAPPQLEIAGVIHQLHHEIFPVNIDAPPEIAEARGKVVKMMCFRKTETVEMQHTRNQVELAGNAQIQKKRRQHELNKFPQVRYVCRITNPIK